MESSTTCIPFGEMSIQERYICGFGIKFTKVRFRFWTKAEHPNTFKGIKVHLLPKIVLIHLWPSRVVLSPLKHVNVCFPPPDLVVACPQVNSDAQFHVSKSRCSIWNGSICDHYPLSAPWCLCEIVFAPLYAKLQIFIKLPICPSWKDPRDSCVVINGRNKPSRDNKWCWSLIYPTRYYKRKRRRLTDWESLVGMHGRIENSLTFLENEGNNFSKYLKLYSNQ